MPWFKNIKTGLSWNVADPDRIRDLKKDEDYDLVPEGEEAPLMDNGGEEDDPDEPEILKQLKNGGKK